MSANSELSINVHVAPMRGFVTSAAPPAGIRPMWSPLCSTSMPGDGGRPPGEISAYKSNHWT
jgi:hypothetical protein